jgi:hypothetical protein
VYVTAVYFGQRYEQLNIYQMTNTLSACSAGTGKMKEKRNYRI